jgi:hypothetical protein
MLLPRISLAISASKTPSELIVVRARLADWGFSKSMNPYPRHLLDSGSTTALVETIRPNFEQRSLRSSLEKSGGRPRT